MVKEQFGHTDSEGRILTAHPAGKQGVRISAEKYHSIRDYIFNCLLEQPGLSYKELDARANQELKDFEGSVSWYVVTVKLDMEARGEIERIPGSRPQRIRLSHQSHRIE
ncbi:MAG: hypothetical protein H6606_00860 [Flavobacteriales bacterium]|nr:hypothetical protein [Flavobacteriales bacterium]